MALKPWYEPSAQHPAYHLRYSWSAWPSAAWCGAAHEPILTALTPLWEQDGLRLLASAWSSERIQLTFSARPDVSPATLAGRAKGRLQHAMRHGNCSFPGFSRKLSVGAVGDNHTDEVINYLCRQVDKEQFADSGFREKLREFTTICRDVDFSVPSDSARGRYWHNLHLVLVTEERFRIASREKLARIYSVSFQIAAKKGYSIGALSVMPDHLHVALRGNIQHSPQEIALSFQNNLAFAIGRCRLWRDTYYVGTFGEYDFGAIRARVAGR